MARQLTDEEERELQRIVDGFEDIAVSMRKGIGRIRDEVANMREGPELDEKRLDRWHKHLQGQGISETIFDFLCIHKTAENWADHFGVGKVRFFLALGAATFFPLLEMVAPEELEVALARWEDEQERPELTLVTGGDDA